MIAPDEASYIAVVDATRAQLNKVLEVADASTFADCKEAADPYNQCWVWTSSMKREEMGCVLGLVPPNRKQMKAEAVAAEAASNIIMYIKLIWWV